MPDLRKYKQQTQNRMVVGLLILLFSAGVFLIYFFYGIQAALSGLLILLALISIITVILLILKALDKIANRG